VQFGSFGSDGHIKIWCCPDAAMTHEGTWEVATSSSLSVNACAARAGLVAVGLGISEEGQVMEESVRLWSIQ
jgi:hypothetical protein